MKVATALTVYGIETSFNFLVMFLAISVATALTVYGIETYDMVLILRQHLQLQQHLPFTVLKLEII